MRNTKKETRYFNLYGKYNEKKNVTECIAQYYPDKYNAEKGKSDFYADYKFMGTYKEKK